MLWLALHLPALSLESFAATLGSAQHALPLVLLDLHQVHSANRVALRLGIKPGMKRATALALAPQLMFGHADVARDAQALRAVAHVALGFTPSVTLEGNPRHSDSAAGVLLEVQASLRYFGGLARLQQRLRDALAPLGFSQRMACAPTAGGAALLARWRDDLNLGPHCRDIERLRDLLDAAPVSLLGPGREHWEALQGMGLHTLSDLRHLPRAGLARRFGEDLLADLDRARGEAADAREWLTLPARFDSSLELHERADSSEQVLHGAAVLLARLAAWARAQPARIGAFTLALRHEARRSDAALPTHSELHIALAEASNDASHLQMLLRERLAHLVLPAPTLELQLRCDQVVRSAAPNGELFPTQASAREGLLRLIERLQARLGPGQVQRALLVEDHRPERGTAWQQALAPVPAALPQDTTLPPRPVWLLAPPQPLPERQLRPLLDGRPLQLLAGPERIESGWWDAEPAARDYFIAQAHDGALVWVYRSRLALAQGPGWFLHGRFG